jgi:ATP-dependent helicase Lhr and Lhr-like helicase
MRVLDALARLHPGLQRLVRDQHWSGLRPIQLAALEPLLDRQHCVIEAPTAGGKTEAVLFPALTRAARAPRDSVQVLYLAPLRALLNNLEGRGETYASACGLEAFKWHGDVSQSSKVAKLQAPPQLLLTTPESVEAILLRKAAWPQFFAELDTVIVDEAHNFAAGDRGGHLLALLERLEAGTGKAFQRIALSATIGNPEEMCQWLMGSRPPARRIAVPADTEPPTEFWIQHFAPDSGGETDEQRAIRLVTQVCAEVQGRRTITFVPSRRQAEELAKAIHLVGKDGIRVQTHHSAVSKYFREEAERLIQVAGEQGIESIISTSTLELGIDIGELDCVLQFGALASPSAFLQRVGRTGRRAGRARSFRGLTQRDDDLLLLLATVSLGLERQSEALRLRRRAFHLLAHQLLCLALQQHGVAPAHAWGVLSKAHVFSGIERHEFDALVRHMVCEDYLVDADGVLVPGEAAERRYLVAGWRKLFAVFNTAPLYDVFEGRTHVGTLDSSFVEPLEVPFFFTLAGRLWKGHQINFDGHTVKASRAREGVAPRWGSFGGPEVSFETAQRFGELVHGHREPPPILDESAAAVFSARRASAVEWQPGSITCILGGGGAATILTYGGDTLNRTLAYILQGKGLETKFSFIAVEVKGCPADPDKCGARLRRELAALSGLGSSTDALEAVLLERQPAWPFSPFAAMLPERLVKASLLEATTDVRRLQEFVRGSKVELVRA